LTVRIANACNRWSVDIFWSFWALGAALLLLTVFCLEHLEGTDELLAHAHQRAVIIELTTIVGRRENRYQLPLAEELVAVLHHLMCPAYQVQAVLFQELADHVITEQVAHSALALRPTLNILGGIRP